MKKSFWGLLFLAFFCVKLSASSRVSLQFNQVPLSFVLQQLAASQNMNILIEEGLDEQISLNLNDINWREALDAIASITQLSIKQKGNVIYVTSNKIDDAEIKKNAHLQELAIKLKYLKSEQVAKLLMDQKVLSSNGKVLFSNEQNNSLIILDDAALFPSIKKWIEESDHLPKKIEIAAYIVTVNRDDLTELGVDWYFQGKSSQSVLNWNLSLPVANPAMNAHFQLAKIGGKMLNFELSALEAENRLQIIANPHLLTSHAQMASIKQGTEIPYEVSTGSNGATSIEFKQAVLGLEVTPRIGDDGMIELDLLITQNTAGNAIKQRDGGEALSIDTQEIKTKVWAKEGETIVLGGVFQQTNQTHMKSVPVLSKIPIIKSLFSYKATKNVQRELVIFITPKIHF